MHEDPPRLLLVAHGTASDVGAVTTAAIVSAVAAARPGVEVSLCFLDVVDPRLADALDDRPTVVVPLLLSTGFHVQTDIPEAVAGFPNARVAAHLGPDPLVVAAVLDRCGLDPNGVVPGSTVLVAAGSSRSAAATEVAAAAELIDQRMRGLVAPHRMRVATMADDLDAVLADEPDLTLVAVYLLAEGAFVTRLADAMARRGLRQVPRPIGAHPSLIELVWHRYDAVAGVR